MPYQSGTVTTAAELRTAVLSFLTVNGYSVSGSVANKGASFVEITASTTELTIRGSRSSTFSGLDLCDRPVRVYFSPWPSIMTYNFHLHASPVDTFWAALNYNVTDYAHFGFGQFVKQGSWVGGSWFHAQHTESCTDSFSRINADASANRAFTSAGTIHINDTCLFNRQIDSAAFGLYGRCSMLHCELRGRIWENSGRTLSQSLGDTISATTMLYPVIQYTPNAFNNQTILWPFQCYVQNTDGHYMALGYPEHVRWTRMPNINPGDVKVIGSDKWKIYPLKRKDAVNSAGSAVTVPVDVPGSTGLMAYAVRYDGP